MIILWSQLGWILVNMATFVKAQWIPSKWYHHRFTSFVVGDLGEYKSDIEYFAYHGGRPFPRGIGMPRLVWFISLVGTGCQHETDLQIIVPTPHSKHSNLGYQTGFAGFGLHAVWGHSWLIPNRWPAVKKMRRCVWIVKSDRSNISQNLKYFSKSHDLANMKVVRCGFCRALMTCKHLDCWEENHNLS